MRHAWRYSIAILAALAGGCKEELGPEQFKTTRVTGFVHEGIHPVGGGWIEFAPVGGTTGDIRSAPLRPDGTFDAGKVPVGRNVVGFVQSNINMPGGKAFFHTFRSPIRRDIPANSTVRLDINLLEEAIRYNTLQGQEAAPP